MTTNLRCALLMQSGVERDGLVHTLGSQGWNADPVSDDVSELISSHERRPSRVVLLHVPVFHVGNTRSIAALRGAIEEVPLIGYGTSLLGDLVDELIDRGLSAYVSSRHSSAELGEVLRSFDAGAAVRPSPASAKGASEARENAPSAREMEVLLHLSQGSDNLKIAALLGVSEHTVKSHVHRLYRKLGAQTRMELILEGARRYGSFGPTAEARAYAGAKALSKGAAETSLIARDLRNIAHAQAQEMVTLRRLRDELCACLDRSRELISGARVVLAHSWAEEAENRLLPE